jgi:multisubunit Na+/H+ antiporter MnhC subunit
VGGVLGGVAGIGFFVIGIYLLGSRSSSLLKVVGPFDLLQHGLGLFSMSTAFVVWALTVIGLRNAL